MVGPSGCGKSTLIRLLAGFEQPTAGRITLDGAPITEPSRDRLVVFQETALFPVDDDVGQHPLRAACARRADAREPRVRRVPARRRSGCRTSATSIPAQLSGGMQRRAELARAMINNPKVMILDEPFRGLDAMTKELMWEYYARLYEENRRTNFFVTTDIDEAVFLADRILVMSNIPTQVRAVIEVDLPRPRRACRPRRKRPRQRHQEAGAVDPARRGDALVLARLQGRGRLRRRLPQARQPRLMEVLLTKPVVVTLAIVARSCRPPLRCCRCAGMSSARRQRRSTRPATASWARACCSSCWPGCRR